MSPQSVLVLAPHPDDESLGCGGTIRLLTRSGVPVDVGFLTRGERGLEVPDMATPVDQQMLAEQRAREAAEACACLGVRSHFFLGGHDGRLAEQAHLADVIANQLHMGGYTRIFCPWPGESHPDHVATYQHCRQAMHKTRGQILLWLYEVWTPLVPNCVVPIDDTMADKEAAIARHVSQLACRDYHTAFRGLASYRALASHPSRFAEAFLVREPGDYS